LSEKTNSSVMTQSDSRVTVRKNAYRRASAILGFVGAGLALIALRFVYFLLMPIVFISATLMLIGGVLVWTRNTAEIGAYLILTGGLFGGEIGHTYLLYALLATVFGNWVYSLPLLPLGMLIPAASFVLAFMSRKQSKTKFPELQQA
jgi:hypothetical protein